MPRVLVVLNSISHTTIPFEVAVRVAETTDTEIVVASLYDDDPAALDIPETPDDLPLEIRPLGATSRLDRAAWRAFRQELSTGYDLVHTHHNFSGSVARVLATLQGHTVVDTEHRDHGSLSPLQNLVNAPTLPLAARIVSNSQVTEESFRWYERRLLNDDQLTVIHNGVDLDRIQRVVETTDRTDEETFRVCTVGRMIPVKNQSTLLRAFRAVVDRQPAAELLLVGDGPYRADLEDLADDLELAENVRFTGVVPRERVYEHFARSDVFAIPSHAEGFCVAAVEAMAAGLPVVASDILVFHEVLGECGAYADSNAPGAFAAELQTLTARDIREKRGEVCRRRAETFSLDRTAAEYDKLYREVTNDTMQ